MRISDWSSDVCSSDLDVIHRAMSVGKSRVASRGSGASLLLLATAIGATVLSPMLPFVPRLLTGYKDRKSVVSVKSVSVRVDNVGCSIHIQKNNIQSRTQHTVKPKSNLTIINNL